MRRICATCYVETFYWILSQKIVVDFKYLCRSVRNMAPSGEDLDFIVFWRLGKKNFYFISIRDSYYQSGRLIWPPQRMPAGI